MRGGPDLDVLPPLLGGLGALAAAVLVIDTTWQVAPARRFLGLDS